MEGKFAKGVELSEKRSNLQAPVFLGPLTCKCMAGLRLQLRHEHGGWWVLRRSNLQEPVFWGGLRAELQNVTDMADISV